MFSTECRPAEFARCRPLWHWAFGLLVTVLSVAAGAQNQVYTILELQPVAPQKVAVWGPLSFSPGTPAGAQTFAASIGTGFFLSATPTGTPKASITLNGVVVIQESDLASGPAVKPVALLEANSITVDMSQAGADSSLMVEIYSVNKDLTIPNMSAATPAAAILRVAPTVGAVRAAILMDGIEVVAASAFESGQAFQQQVQLGCLQDEDEYLPGCQQARVVPLQVSFSSDLGTSFDLEIVAIDNTPPSITHTLNLEAPGSGWFKSPVVVTFHCEDAESGLATAETAGEEDSATLGDAGTPARPLCTRPVTVSTEGANQQVQGTAQDLAGNTASDSLTVSIDVTSPVIQVTSPLAGTVFTTHDVTVGGLVSDALSGIGSVSCKSVNPPLSVSAQLSGNEFSCDLADLPTVGEIPITLEATDLAGNTTVLPYTLRFMLPKEINENCLALMANRATNFNRIPKNCVGRECTGTFFLSNLPAQSDPMRTQVVCPKIANQNGQSDLLQFPAGAQVEVPQLMFGQLIVPASIQLSAPSLTLTSVGQTTQVSVNASMPTGTSTDVTARPGTFFTTSNPQIASVSSQGVVTARASGNAIISARHEGAVGVLPIQIALNDDSDHDGMPDQWELEHGFNPGDAADASQDNDGDGLTNLQEYQAGTDPRVADTDGDGLNDAAEFAQGTGALTADSDGDGLLDADEIARGTNPKLADSDGDGLPDGVEVALGLNPLSADSNGNSVPDGAEDTDGDGLSNADELQRHTNPKNPDTDGDGIGDGQEVASGDNPLVVETTPPIVTIKSPSAGTRLIEGQTLVIAVDAKDNASVTNLSIALNGILFGDAVPPYELIFTVPFGLQGLTIGASAVDQNGNVGSANDISLAVVADPMTTVTGTVVKADGTPAPQVTAAVQLQGLQAEFFKFSTLSGLPDLSGLTPAGTRRVSSLNFINPENHFSADPFGVGVESNYAVRFSGTLVVGARGGYVLQLLADDGARLLLGGIEVLRIAAAADGPAQGSVGLQLDAGNVPLIVEYYHGVGAAQVQLSMHRTGTEKQGVRPGILLETSALPSATTGTNGSFSVAGIPTSLGSLRATVAVGADSGASAEFAPAAGTTNLGTISVQASAGAFKVLASGNDHTCAVGKDEDVYCWGRGDLGQLGKSGGGGSPAPVVAMRGLGAVAIAAGGNHTCALNSIGLIFCWGDSSQGQLAAKGGSSGPVPVPGSFSTAVAAGANHSCALSSSGAAYCWGRGSEGQLGNASNAGSEAPVPVAGGQTFVAIEAGGNQTCGLAPSGETMCWGQGLLASSNVPLAIRGSTALGFASVNAGSAHACAAGVSATAFCWGRGDEGQLGNSPSESSTVPVSVAGELSFRQLSGGEGHTCAITPRGTAYCWGANASGQLGDGTTLPRTTAVAVAGESTFDSITGGRAHSCAVTRDGAAFCWGSNAYGQLGIGSTTDSSRPRRVNDSAIKVPR